MTVTCVWKQVQRLWLCLLTYPLCSSVTPDQGLQTVTDGSQRDAPQLPQVPPRLLKTQWKWFPHLGWCQAQRGKPCDTGGGTPSRCAIEEPKGELLLLVWGVDVVAAQNVLAEVLVHHSGVIADPQLLQPWSPQQQVLIVDEGVGAAAQALVVVPFGPIQTVQ